MSVLDENVSLEDLKNTLNNIESIYYGKPFVHKIYPTDNPDFSSVVVEGNEENKELKEDTELKENKEED